MYTRQGVIVDGTRVNLMLPDRNRHPEFKALAGKVAVDYGKIAHDWCKYGGDEWVDDEKFQLEDEYRVQTRALVVELLARGLILDELAEGTSFFDRACDGLMDCLAEIEQLERNLKDQNVYLAFQALHGSSTSWPFPLVASLRRVFKAWGQQDRPVPGWANRHPSESWDQSFGARLRREYVQASARIQGEPGMSQVPRGRGSW